MRKVKIFKSVTEMMNTLGPKGFVLGDNGELIGPKGSVSIVKNLDDGWIQVKYVLPS